LRSGAPLGARLQEAAALARTPWLMFLRPGTVPEAGWVEAVENFIRSGGQAASFRRSSRCSFWDLLGRSVPPRHGLLISARTYRETGGHPPIDDAEAALLRKLRRIALLPASVRTPVR
jgi:hypothetical protein